MKYDRFTETRGVVRSPFNSPQHFSHPRSSRRGFTLMEALVLLTTLIVILSMLTPALSYSIVQAKRSVCAANLRQQGMAMKSYAEDMDQYYPSPISNGHWPEGGMTIYGINESKDGIYPPGGQVVLFVHQYVVEHDTFYCPANPGEWVGIDLTWQAENEEDSLRYFNTFIDYPYFGGGWKSIHDTEGLLFNAAAHDARSPGDRVMTADRIAIDYDNEGFQTANHQFQGDSVQRDAADIEYSSAPQGGNVLSNDVAVDWRDFGRTTLRLVHPIRDRWFWF